MKFEIDLTKVQDIKPIPSGIYALKIVDVDGTKKSKTGNRKLIIKTEILAPASVAKEQKFFWFSLSLVESALFKTKQLFEVLGVKLSASGFDTADLIGRTVGAAVSEEETPEYGHRNQIAQFIPEKETKPEVEQKAAG